MSIIEVKNLTFGYSRQDILRNLSFDIEPGSFVAIAGPNGAGKTTLLNLLCGLLKPKKGSVTIDAKNIKAYKPRQLAEKVAIVRQEFVPAFGFSVTETVSMARTIHYNQLGFETPADREIIAEALEATDTLQFADRLLSCISGGERQRVFIARALAQNSPILLLDEPTSFLDLRHQMRIYDLLKQMQQQKAKTIVAITHDINLAAQYCDQVLLLASDCQYHMGQTADILTEERIKTVFNIDGSSIQHGTQNIFIPRGKFTKNQ